MARARRGCYVVTMNGRRASRGTRGAPPRLSDDERARAEAEGVVYMARWGSRAQHLQRVFVAVVVPWLVANLAWGEGVMQLPALVWLAWPAASGVIYLTLQRWARSANATTGAFLATVLLQLVVQIVTRPGPS